MNENVGASFGLSVLIVVFFAVVLYQPELPEASVRTPADRVGRACGSPTAGRLNRC